MSYRSIPAFKKGWHSVSLSQEFLRLPLEGFKADRPPLEQVQPKTPNRTLRVLDERAVVSSARKRVAEGRRLRRKYDVK